MLDFTKRKRDGAVDLSRRARAPNPDAVPAAIARAVLGGSSCASDLGTGEGSASRSGH